MDMLMGPREKYLEPQHGRWRVEQREFVKNSEPLTADETRLSFLVTLSRISTNALDLRRGRLCFPL